MNETRFREAAFMGKATAGLTHELKNIFAIIKETAGLMEDLMAASKDGAFPHQERFVRSLNRIGDQVSRGVHLAVMLNRFAHSPDEVLATVNLGEIADLAAFLSHRRARSMNVSLKAAEGDPSLAIATDPFRVQMVLFECIGLLTQLESRGTLIVIEPISDKSGRPALKLAYEQKQDGSISTNPESSPLWPALLDVAQSVQAGIRTTDSSPGVIISFDGSAQSGTS